VPASDALKSWMWRWCEPTERSSRFDRGRGTAGRYRRGPSSIRTEPADLLPLGAAQGYAVDPRILELKRPKVPKKEPTVFHIRQVHEILAACNPRVSQEDLAVRILLGSGIRESELCALALVGPDRMSDLMLDFMCARPGRAAGALGRRRHGTEVTPRADHREAGGSHQALRGTASPRDRASSCRTQR